LASFFDMVVADSLLQQQHATPENALANTR
jgi:hypothetical protein